MMETNQDKRKITKQDKEQLQALRETMRSKQKNEGDMGTSSDLTKFMEQSTNLQAEILNNTGKVGLDIENGRFRVEGAITMTNVYRKKRAGTNVVPVVGYMLKDMVTGNLRGVTKEQGIKLCGDYGMRNAYITERTRKAKNNDSSEMNRTAIYLQPYPSREQAFTLDDRLVPAFELDSNGAVIKPPNVLLTQEQCSEELWNLIMQKTMQYRQERIRTRKTSQHEQGHKRNLAKIQRKLDEIKPIDISKLFKL